jgi:hypothetical protein
MGQSEQITGACVLKLLVWRTLVHAGVVTPFTTKEGKVSGEDINTISVNSSTYDKRTVCIDNGERDSSDSEKFRVHLVSLGAFELGESDIHWCALIYTPNIDNEAIAQDIELTSSASVSVI